MVSPFISKSHSQLNAISEGRDLAKRFNAQCIETSAKQRVNVDEAFIAVVRAIRRYQKVCLNTLMDFGINHWHDCKIRNLVLLRLWMLPPNLRRALSVVEQLKRMIMSIRDAVENASSSKGVRRAYGGTSLDILLLFTCIQRLIVRPIDDEWRVLRKRATVFFLDIIIRVASY